MLLGSVGRMLFGVACLLTTNLTAAAVPSPSASPPPPPPLVKASNSACTSKEDRSCWLC